MPTITTSLHGHKLGLDNSDNLVVNAKIREKIAAVTVDNTAGNLTVTATMLLSKVIARDPNGGNRTDTLPTATLLMAELAKLGGAEVGDILEVHYLNTADAAETITLAAGTGGTVGNTKVTTAFGQNTALHLVFRITGVATPTYTVYAT
jgi:hypothetical protein